MEERGQFTLYRSHWAAIQRIKKAEHRAAAYDALCDYALNGVLPDLDKLPDAAAIVFDMAKPVLDSSRKKSLSGKKGGERSGSPEPEAAAPQPAPDTPEPLAQGSREKKPERHRFGANGWVRLTEEEHARLLAELGQAELERCIRYVDESAQSNGNKNRWKDWNLILRKCHRDGWGLKSYQRGYCQSQEPPKSESKGIDLDRLKKLTGSAV